MRAAAVHAPATFLSCTILALAAAGARADLLGPGRALAPEAGEPGKDVKRVEELDKALESFKRREYDRALAHLKAARQKYPSLPPARLLLARMHFAAGQPSPGRAELEEAAREAPDYPGVYLAFGELALAEGRLTDAGALFEKAAALARSDRWGDGPRRFFLLQQYSGQATLAESRADWPSARAALGAWLELEPDHGRARQRLARALFQLDKPAEATRELERACRDDPALPPPAVAMAWLYAAKGDRDRAAEWMGRAVRQAPEDPRVHVEMAALLLQQGRVSQAQEHADKAARLGPEAKDLKLLRGVIARHLGNYAQAEALLQAVCQEAPDDFQAGNQLALVLADQPGEAKRRRALQLAEANLRLYPSSAEALATRGWAYFRLGRLDEAERDFDAVTAAGPLTAEAAYHLAHVLAERGRTDQVKQLLKAALDAPGCFPFRKEVEEWLDRLGKKN